MEIGKTGLAVLISGGGRTLQNFIDRIKQGSLHAEIKTVISSRRDAYGLRRARGAGLPAFCAEYKKLAREEFEEAVYGEIERSSADLVLLAGFMHVFPVRKSWKGRIMNIHPALIPSFSGKGYYGDRVHRAVLEYGVKISGCTVHFADEDYDRGPIILQKAVPVMDDDTPATLAERVFGAECGIYPEAVRLYSDNRLEVRGRRVLVKNEKRK